MQQYGSHDFSLNLRLCKSSGLASTIKPRAGIGAARSVIDVDGQVGRAVYLMSIAAVRLVQRNLASCYDSSNSTST